MACWGRSVCRQCPCDLRAVACRPAFLHLHPPDYLGPGPCPVLDSVPGLAPDLDLALAPGPGPHDPMPEPLRAGSTQPGSTRGPALAEAPAGPPIRASPARLGRRHAAPPIRSRPRAPPAPSPTARSPDRGYCRPPAPPLAPMRPPAPRVAQATGAPFPTPVAPIASRLRRNL